MVRQGEAKSVNCAHCRERRQQKARGCYPLHRMAKPVPITGRPDLKDAEASYHCAASVSGTVAQAGWFSDYNRMKDGHLPRSTIWGEHSHRWCQGIDLLDSEIRRREAESLEDAQEKAKAKRGSHSR